jgi:hypothetical protein
MTLATGKKLMKFVVGVDDMETIGGCVAGGASASVVGKLLNIKQ